VEVGTIDVLAFRDDRLAVEGTAAVCQVAADQCEPTFRLRSCARSSRRSGRPPTRNFHRKVTGVPVFLVDRGARTPGSPGGPIETTVMAFSMFSLTMLRLMWHSRE
jgi:hypothetical protein